MIDGKKLDHTYTQNGNTCVLSSYGIVNHYYTRTLIENVFRDYCKHFNLTDKKSLSVRYDAHFHTYIGENKMSGYQCVVDLHNNSDKDSFKQGRNSFKVVSFATITDKLEEIEKHLTTEESLINLTFNINGTVQYHSISVYCDMKDGLFKIHDTQKKIFIEHNKLYNLISELCSKYNCRICDANLYLKV